MTGKILRVQKLHEGRSSFSLVTIGNDTGDEYRRSVEDHGEAVAVLPYDPARRVALLVEQLRVGPLYADRPAMFLEAPAGLRDSGEEPGATARREVLEETGVQLGVLEHLGAVWTCPAFSTEHVDLFLAPYAAGDRVAPGGGLADEHEHIVVKELPIADLISAADRCAITDMKTLLLVLALARRHPELSR